jgi:hypothetical protein
MIHVPGVRQDRELPLRRDGQELRARRAEGNRLRVLGSNREEFRNVPYRCRTVDDGLPIGSEARHEDRSRLEGFLRERDSRRAAAPDAFSGEERAGRDRGDQRRECDRNEPTRAACHRRRGNARTGGSRQRLEIEREVSG